MAKNKVIYNGETLIDLTNDTVTADSLLEGYTAHGADGQLINGAAKSGTSFEVCKFYMTIVNLSNNVTFYYTKVVDGELVPSYYYGAQPVVVDNVLVDSLVVVEGTTGYEVYLTLINCELLYESKKATAVKLTASAGEQAAFVFHP